jgi:ketosteroid isomerase-like protein
VTTDEDDARRAANYALYERMQEAQRDGDKDAWLACFTDDVVFEAPAYRDGPIAKGRDGMARVFDSMQERFSSIHYEIMRFIPAVDPDLVLAEVRGDNAVRNSTSRYRNQYLFIVTCRGGRIAGIYEYSNPSVYADAVGD